MCQGALVGVVDYVSDLKFDVLSWDVVHGHPPRPRAFPYLIFVKPAWGDEREAPEPWPDVMEDAVVF